MSTTAPLRSLNINNINPHVREAKYAVRGELAVRSEEYRAMLAKGATDLPFDQVIAANIGNPQQLDQKPITFFRQVLSLVEYPALLEKEDVLLEQLGYKSDVIARAKWLLKEVGSVGAYSASAGAPGIKESIAKFLESTCGLWFFDFMILTCAPQDEMVSLPSQRTSTYPLEPRRESTPCCI
jgi:alanine transaminase